MTQQKDSTPKLAPACEMCKDTLTRLLDEMEASANRHEEALELIGKMEETLRAIAKTFDTHFSEALNALVGKNQLPMAVVMKMVQVFSLATVALLMALILTLTGQHFNLLPVLN